MFKPGELKLAFFPRQMNPAVLILIPCVTNALIWPIAYWKQVWVQLAFRLEAS